MVPSGLLDESPKVDDPKVNSQESYGPNEEADLSSLEDDDRSVSDRDSNKAVPHLDESPMKRIANQQSGKLKATSTKFVPSFSKLTAASSDQEGSHQSDKALPSMIPNSTQ